MSNNLHIMPLPEERRKTGLLTTASKVNLIILCILLFTFASVLLTEYLTNIICMIAAALIITYILLGPVTWLERGLLKLKLGKRTLSPQPARTLSIVLVYLMCFGILLISIFRVAPALAAQISEFARVLPGYVSEFTQRQAHSPHDKKAPLATLVQKSLEKSSTQTQVGTTQITTETLTQNRVKVTDHTTGSQSKAPLLNATYAMALEQLLANFKSYASRLGSLLLDVGSATVSGIIYGLTTLVLVFYLLHDGKELQKGLVKLLPARYEASFEHFLKRLHIQFHTIVKGQVLMSLLSGGLMYTLLLLLDAKFALLLSVFFGLTSILPVIGPWIGLIPIISLLAFSSHPLDILQILMATGLFYLVKTFWLWPKLIRRKYDIHPILFTLSFLACLKLAGLLGILFSFPLATVLGVIASSLKERHGKIPSSEIITAN